MQYKNPKHQEDLEPVDTFKHLFYPEYPPNASPQEFLLHYEPLFQELQKIDLISEDQFKKLAIYTPPPKQKFDELDKLIEFIVDELNDLCTFCHRKQLRMKIVHEASQYQNHLKNRPVGKKPIKLSHWENYLQLPKTQIESIAEDQTKQKILAILDKIYQEHKRIPNYYSLFLSMPELLIHLYEFEEKIIFDSVSEKTSLSLVHKYYLGVIAASTYGSRYLWNFMVAKFLKYGGDPKWIQTGLDELPQSVKKFSQASYQMAYQFNVNILQDICFQLGKILQDSAILEGFYILSYFQFLACVSLVFGLVPESSEYEKVFLPEVPFIRPSPQSFQTMKKVSNKEARYENEMAREFEEMYSWQKDSEKQNFKRVELQLLEKKTSSSKKLTQKLSSSSSQSSATTFISLSNGTIPTEATGNPLVSYENQLMISIQEQEIIKKLKSSKTMEYIERVYCKYVEFDKRRSLVQFKRHTDKKTRVSNGNGNEQGEQSNESSSSTSEDEFIYASEWNFQSNTSSVMESAISPTFHKIVCGLLKSLKLVDTQKSKNLKMYYQSLQNYMYEYINYVNLINEGLSQVEKNYIKLLTRSPFLFNEKSFLKMKEDLESVCKICQPFRFGLEVFSFKLEHSMSLLSYAYSRYIENK